MTYATRNDLVDQFTETEINNLEAGGRDASDCLAKASEEIDTYLLIRYAVPVSPAPAHLVTICCDIARYRLYADAAQGEPKERYDGAISWLTKVSRGDVLLPGVALAAGDGSTSRGQTPPRNGKGKTGFDWGGYGP